MVEELRWHCEGGTGGCRTALHSLQAAEGHMRDRTRHGGGKERATPYTGRLCFSRGPATRLRAVWRRCSGQQWDGGVSTAVEVCEPARLSAAGGPKPRRPMRLEGLGNARASFDLQQRARRRKQRDALLTGPAIFSTVPIAVVKGGNGGGRRSSLCAARGLLEVLAR
jgi:hypothetical protein